MAGPTGHAYEVSVPLPGQDALRRVLGEAFDPATTLNAVQKLAGTEDMYAATAGLVRAVFAAEGVDPKLRQMVILRAAKVLNVPYEWEATVRMSLKHGLLETHSDAAGSDGPVEGIEPDYVLVCRATDELSKTGTLTDETLRSLLDRHSEVIARKLILIIAWFNLLSLFLNGCRVPMEASDKIGSKRTPFG